MKTLIIAVLAGSLLFGLGACSSNPFASVGVGATYTDGHTGDSYGADVNATFRDADGKTIKRPRSATLHRVTPGPVVKVAASPTPMPFREALGRGLLRLVDTPQPGEPRQGPHLEEIAYGNTYTPR